jgi:hypothetical protein
MAMVNSFVNLSALMPMIDVVMIMCPVEETGRNSVNPSTMAIMIA